MRPGPTANQINGRSRIIPLRYRFILMTTATLVLLLGVLSLILGTLQSRTIRSQIEKRGLAIARNLAATSLSDLLRYDYITLEQAVNQIARDPALANVIVHDKEGRVAGYSGPARSPAYVPDRCRHSPGTPNGDPFDMRSGAGRFFPDRFGGCVSGF